MLVFIGASASGKTEIAKILINHYDFEKVVTYTSRPMRAGEINGVDYHFVDAAAFEAKLKREEFIESVVYNGNFYGTAFKDTDVNKVLIVDPNGANVLQEKLGDNAVFFYLEASEHVRYERMLKRGDHLREIKKRIKKDRERFQVENLLKVDFQVQTNHHGLYDLARHIFEQYRQELLNRGKITMRESSLFHKV